MIHLTSDHLDGSPSSQTIQLLGRDPQQIDKYSHCSTVHDWSWPLVYLFASYQVQEIQSSQISHQPEDMFPDVTEK